jgi:AraC family transcriptional regulator of adaptative response/methylated-DNA-[protein]-cysteine methyltransferase
MIRAGPASWRGTLQRTASSGIRSRPPASIAVPSCPSRAANPANVAIHDSLAAARATGFRACLRCRPDDLAPADRQADLVTRACRLLDEAEEGVPLATLAAAVGLSPAHFHRTFRAATGLTPRAFASARRAERMRAALGGGAPVTRAIHEAGFGSTSRFYERADEMLGMPPARFRTGGAGELLHHGTAPSSLGLVLAAAGPRGVAAILIGTDPATLLADLRRRFPKAQLRPGDAAFETLLAQVIATVEAPGTNPALPLDIRGTAFQQRVWQALGAVPGWRDRQLHRTRPPHRRPRRGPRSRRRLERRAESLMP